MAHHRKAFETGADVGGENTKMDHRKIQHFIRGKVGELLSIIIGCNLEIIKTSRNFCCVNFSSPFGYGQMNDEFGFLNICTFV